MGRGGGVHEVESYWLGLVGAEVHLLSWVGHRGSWQGLQVMVFCWKGFFSLRSSFWMW